MTKLIDYVEHFECHISDDSQSVEQIIYLREITDLTLVRRILKEITADNNDGTLTCRLSGDDVMLGIHQATINQVGSLLDIELTLMRSVPVHTPTDVHQLKENVAYTAGRMCYELLRLEFA